MNLPVNFSMIVRRQACILAVLATLACGTPPHLPAPAHPSTSEDCIVSIDEVDGAHVVLVYSSRMPIRKATLNRLPIVLASTSSKRGVVVNSERLIQTARALIQDPYIGDFVRDMNGDPDVTYYVWDTKLLDWGGGGVTEHCREDRFDIWINLEHHLKAEGGRCTNPAGSGSLRSLLAHELGHAWAWRHYGDDDICDNESMGNKISVTWESTQLAGNVQRLLHNPPGCRCHGS